MNKLEFDRTILSQYASSVKMLMLLDKMNNAIDPDVDISNFERNVFNLDTCGAYGLKVWGRIVAAPRTLEIEETDYLGFDGQDLEGFNHDPFYGEHAATTSYTVGDEAYRRLIYYKAYVNIVNTTLPDLNKALWMLFEDGRPGIDDLYIQELVEGNMTMRIIFRFALTPIERALIKTYGYLLRPAGVGMKVYEIPRTTFGFEGSDLFPFDQGTFWSGLIGEIK